VARDIVIGEASPFAAGFLLAGLTLGQRLAAERRGWELRTVDAGFSAARQAEDIDALVALGVDAITTWTLDPETAEPALERAHSAGIPLVGFNSDSSSFDTVVKLAIDASPEPAADAAHYIAERIPGAKVAVIAGPLAPTLVFRASSFREAAAEHGLEIVADVDNLGDLADPAELIVRDLLAEPPELDAIWCFNDPSAIGAGRALRSAGRSIWSGSPEGVIVVGINGTQEAIDAIADGSITLTYESDPIEAGAAAIGAIAAAINGNGTSGEMSREITIPSRRFDTSNIDSYVPWQARTG
jgi:ribose transport system substrate-binding protein